MLISESKSFLFVHVQKTAGTSLADILAPHALQPMDGRLNKLASDLGLVRDWRKFHFRKHANLRKAQSVLPASVYDGMFKFAFVRNPWERLVSWYEMMRTKGMHNDFSRYLMQADRFGRPPDFSDFIRRTAVIQEHAMPESQWSGTTGLFCDQSQGYPKSLCFNQLDYLTDPGGTMVCDRIIRFDRLAQEFAAVLTEIHPGRDHPTLAHLNARSAPVDWRTYYQSSDDREWVARLYQRDVDHFGFRFDA